MAEAIFRTRLYHYENLNGKVFHSRAEYLKAKEEGWQESAEDAVESMKYLTEIIEEADKPPETEEPNIITPKRKYTKRKWK